LTLVALAAGAPASLSTGLCPGVPYSIKLRFPEKRNYIVTASHGSFGLGTWYDGSYMYWFSILESILDVCAPQLYTLVEWFAALVDSGSAACQISPPQ
jgi:hypothetical protein